MMTATQLEDRLARFYKNFPPLPGPARRWLGANAWWIIMIVAILSAIGCLGLISGLVGLLALNRQSMIYGVGYGAVSTVQTVIGLLSGVVGTVLYFCAVRPLRDMRHRGWSLILYAQLAGLAFSLLSIVLTTILGASPLTVAGMLVGFVIGVAFTVLWLYFVFQVRDEFGSRAAKATRAKIVSKK